MGIKTIFNPLLEEGFQKVNDANAEYVQTVQTTDATQTTLSNSKAITAGSVQSFVSRITAIEGATDDVWVHEVRGAIKRTTAGVTSLIEPVIEETFAEDAGAALWSVSFVANDTTDVLEIKVTGEAAHTIEWKAETVFSEVIY